MTVPEERENERSVLDILGFGTPARLEPVEAPAEHPALPHGFAGRAELEAPDHAVAAPITRRELRDRERSAEPLARRSAPTTSSRTRPAKPRRAARSTLRRDAVRASTTSGARKKTIGARLLSFGAMLFAGALAFGMTVPANAFGTGSDATQLSATLAMPAQSAEVDPTLVSFSDRDAWTVTLWAQMIKERYGSRTFDYTVGVGPIQWPFPVPVTISSGFGARAAPCRGCSTMHSGIDFTPGSGAAIFAIADGIVVEHDDGNGSWGNYVIIQHEIDGQTIYSGYAHMQHGSSALQVGDQIKVGDFIGLVGATGEATGAHLHFTISIGEKMGYVDPFTWLKTYAAS